MSNTPILWIALGLIFICLMLYGVAFMLPGTETDWQWIATTLTAYIIVLTVIGGALFILFRYVGRR